MKEYDVIILGAGSAGLSARSEVAKQTDNYLVVDAGPLGTTCARVGCMPSKVIIEAAAIFHQRTKFEAIGASPCDSASLDSAKLMQHVRSLRDRFVRSVMQEIEPWRATHLRNGTARFVGRTEIEIDGERVRAKKIIVATGSEPVVPEAWRKVGSALVTTDSFFELTSLPDRIAVIGAGAIGLELSQALARLGIEVSLFGEAGVIGGLKDPEMIAYATPVFARELRYVPGLVETVRAGEGDRGAVVVSGGKDYSVDLVLAAIGRKPRLGDLNLAALGVALDKKGLPPIDPRTFRVEGTAVFFAGDVNTLRPILHEASDQGRTVGRAPSDNPADASRCRARLAITFTSPQIALVGRSFADLNGEDFVVGEARFDGQGRALTKLENVGILRVYGKRVCGQILGAELFCPAGEHLAHLLNWAIDTECTVFDLLRRPFYHPSLEEGLRTALRDLSRKVEITPDPWSEIHTEDPPAGTYCP